LSALSVQRVNHSLLGAMLYEILSGRRPFTGGLLQVLSQQRAHQPLPPSAHVAGIPPWLDELCIDLLALEPAKRPNGRAIRERLSSCADRS